MAGVRLSLTGAGTRQHGAHRTVNPAKSEIRRSRNTCLKLQRTTGATTVPTHTVTEGPKQPKLTRATVALSHVLANKAALEHAAKATAGD